MSKIEFTFVDCHGTECGGIYAESGAEVVNCVVADSKPWQVIEGEYTKDNNIPVAGDSSAFVNCATDGDTAINDTCVIGTAVDIGAYELQSAPQPRGMVIIYR